MRLRKCKACSRHSEAMTYLLSSSLCAAFWLARGRWTSREGKGTRLSLLQRPKGSFCLVQLLLAPFFAPKAQRVNLKAHFLVQLLLETYALTSKFCSNFPAITAGSILSSKFSCKAQHAQMLYRPFEPNLRPLYVIMPIVAMLGFPLFC